jgi:DNA-binding MarR family transcriptional regulator/N-acetylglutamate synthase-like GNAT family acetyltransferase
MPHADTVRAFNRFYTRRIGALGDHWLDSPYSLTEMRVLYELAHRDDLAATELGQDLGVDAGYLSRILRKFETDRLIARTAAPSDGRRSLLRLTPRGRTLFAPYEKRAQQEVDAMLGTLAARQRREVVDAMQTIQRALGGATGAAPAAYVLRPPEPGDMGWVVQRHGALYAREWGYDSGFEALVARIVADFVDHHDPARERCWIAEKDGENVGSVFLVQKSSQVAKLRLLIVDPQARGLGIGHRLVDECIRFARHAGYRKVTLWTHSQLTAARRIYQQAGFTCIDRTRVRSFGRKLVDEIWELKC